MRAILIAGALAVTGAHADEATRVAYVERALEALRATPATALAQAEKYAQTMSGSSCASQLERLEIECLMTASQKYCRKKSEDPQRCALVLDVVVARLLGDAQLIPTEERYQIMTRAKDYRAELERESRRRAGALAVDFRLRMGAASSDAQLARNLDHYCLTASDENAMPWQACVSSLVWFIVTETPGSHP